MSKCEKLVAGYFRHMQKALDIDMPDDILLVLLLFYAKYIEFEACTIKLTDDEKEMITNWLLDTFSIPSGNGFLSSTVLYDKGTDGGDWDTSNKKCEHTPNTFSIIKIKNHDHIIGYFLSKAWIGSNKGYVEDDKAFLCVIRSSFNDRSPIVYRINERNESSAFYIDYGQMYFGSNEFYIHEDEGGETWACRLASFFEPPITSNMLAGGDTYRDLDMLYQFEIEAWNVFKINIDH